MKTNRALWMVGLAGGLLQPMVYALPSFVSKVPNGNVNSCATCHTSAPSLNPFGADFLSAGTVWTAALAALDSDHDGFTNGQELGDPKGTGTAIPGAPVSSPGDAAVTPKLLPPLISLTGPTNGATFAAPFNGQLTATSTNTPAAITQVQFFSGMNLLGTVAAPPYALSVSNLLAGAYTFTATATDYLGSTHQSTPVMITVLAPANLVLQLTAYGNDLVFQWTGGNGGSVTLQKRTSLSDTNWTDVMETANPTISIHREDANAFFRLKE
jgi:hypothetical protein